ncbi:MAG: hypothetical protein AABX02_01940 [archaeon]
MRGFVFTIVAFSFLIVLSATVHAGIYYNPSNYGATTPTVIPFVPVVPSYYQPVQHVNTYSYPLAQPYYVPYPVYVNSSYHPATTIAVSNGVTIVKDKPNKPKKQKTKVIHAKVKHHNDFDFPDFDMDFDFDFPSFHPHDPDSDDFDDAWDDIKDWFD